jgi:hypothetical protein
MNPFEASTILPTIPASSIRGPNMPKITATADEAMRGHLTPGACPRCGRGAPLISPDIIVHGCSCGYLTVLLAHQLGDEESAHVYAVAESGMMAIGLDGEPCSALVMRGSRGDLQVAMTRADQLSEASRLALLRHLMNGLPKRLPEDFETGKLVSSGRVTFEGFRYLRGTGDPDLGKSIEIEVRSWRAEEPAFAVRFATGGLKLEDAEELAHKFAWIAEVLR